MARADKSKIACSVLAAGLSSRFEGVKQLAMVRGKPLIQNAIDSANWSKADYIYLVLGHNASEIAAGIRPGRGQILLNKGYMKGLSSSLKTTISNLPQDCAAVLFVLGDQPFVTTRNLNKMIRNFKMDTEMIIALSTGKEPRNPVLFPRRFFEEILGLYGDAGAREILIHHPRSLKLIEIKDEKTFLDIDTRTDLKKSFARN